MKNPHTTTRAAAWIHVLDTSNSRRPGLATVRLPPNENVSGPLRVFRVSDANPVRGVRSVTGAVGDRLAPERTPRPRRAGRPRRARPPRAARSRGRGVGDRAADDLGHAL